MAGDDREQHKRSDHVRTRTALDGIRADEARTARTDRVQPGSPIAATDDRDDRDESVGGRPVPFATLRERYEIANGTLSAELAMRLEPHRRTDCLPSDLGTTT